MRSNKLGNFMKAKRIDNNILLKDLAKVLRLDLSFISKVENGSRTINPKHFKKLSKSLGVTEKDICSLWIYDSVMGTYGKSQLFMESFIHAASQVKLTTKDNGQKTKGKN